MHCVKKFQGYRGVTNSVIKQQVRIRPPGPMGDICACLFSTSESSSRTEKSSKSSSRWRELPPQPLVEVPRELPSQLDYWLEPTEEAFQYEDDLLSQQEPSDSPFYRPSSRDTRNMLPTESLEESFFEEDWDGPREDLHQFSRSSSVTENDDVQNEQNEPSASSTGSSFITSYASIAKRRSSRASSEQTQTPSSWFSDESLPSSRSSSSDVGVVETETVEWGVVESALLELLHKSPEDFPSTSSRSSESSSSSPSPSSTSLTTATSEADNDESTEI